MTSWKCRPRCRRFAAPASVSNRRCADRDKRRCWRGRGCVLPASTVANSVRSRCPKCCYKRLKPESKRKIFNADRRLGVNPDKGEVKENGRDMGREKGEQCDEDRV